MYLNDPVSQSTGMNCYNFMDSNFFSLLSFGRKIESSAKRQKTFKKNNHYTVSGSIRHESV